MTKLFSWAFTVVNVSLVFALLTVPTFFVGRLESVPLFAALVIVEAIIANAVVDNFFGRTATEQELVAAKN